MLFELLLIANSKESKNAGTNQQVSVEGVDGMGGVMNERHLEANVMGQQMSVEDGVPLVLNEIVKRSKWKRVKMLEKHVKSILMKLKWIWR